MPRLLWYAPGGGLGHLTRAIAILQRLRPLLGEQAELLLVVTTPHLYPALLHGVPVLRLPSRFESADAGAFRALFTSLWEAFSPTAAVVDTFADGLAQELTPAHLSPLGYSLFIQRLGASERATSACWSHFCDIVAPYPTCPDPEVQALGYVTLRRPAEVYSRPQARRRLGVSDECQRLILALHSGDPGEAGSFFALTTAAIDALQRPELLLRLLSPLPSVEGHDPRWLHYYPAMELLLGADLVLAGGGYNSVAELNALGVRALLCPFGRSHDDQASRISAPFALTDPPQLLAQRIAAALQTPPPAPLPLAAVDGAQAIAELIAARLGSSLAGSAVP